MITLPVPSLIFSEKVAMRLGLIFTFEVSVALVVGVKELRVGAVISGGGGVLKLN